ncbi:MAG TPA: tyrosine-type recombinase/integrase [Phycisphaerae bacterium]|nr:tyrosine-type recombinase/integrase [Phycisphaerae bacterium]
MVARTPRRPAAKRRRTPVGGGETPAARVLAAFLATGSVHTRRAYACDLDAFCAFLAIAGRLPKAEPTRPTRPRGGGAQPPESDRPTGRRRGAAVAELLGWSPGHANEQVGRYAGWMRSAGYALTTVNRRVASLRSLVRTARLFGFIAWTVDVQVPRAAPLRDTRGPGRDGVERMIAVARDRTDAKGGRDLVILRMLFDLGLRRSELQTLDVAHVRLDARPPRVAILPKGRQQRDWMTLPLTTADAVAHWLALRGPGDGALITTRWNGSAGEPDRRITAEGIYAVVRQLAAAAGIHATPHGLRHAAITEALDLTGGDVRAVQQFSRHADLNHLKRYDDARRDDAGRIAEMVSEGRRDPENAPRTAPHEG